MILPAKSKDLSIQEFSETGEALVYHKGQQRLIRLSRITYKVLQMCDERSWQEAVSSLAREGVDNPDQALSEYLQELSRDQLVSSQTMPKLVEKLIVKSIAGEALVYNSETNVAHSLNATATRVFHFCDGLTPVDRVAALLDTEFSLDGAGESLVWMTLAEFVKQGLLSPGVTVRPGYSRREFLGKFAAAAALMPVVSGALAPRPVFAASCIAPVGCVAFVECGNACDAGSGCTSICASLLYTINPVGTPDNYTVSDNPDCYDNTITFVGICTDSSSGGSMVPSGFGCLIANNYTCCRAPSGSNCDPCALSAAGAGGNRFNSNFCQSNVCTSVGVGGGGQNLFACA